MQIPHCTSSCHVIRICICFAYWCLSVGAVDTLQVPTCICGNKQLLGFHVLFGRFWYCIRYTKRLCKAYWPTMPKLIVMKCEKENGFTYTAKEKWCRTQRPWHRQTWIWGSSWPTWPPSRKLWGTASSFGGGCLYCVPPTQTLWIPAPQQFLQGSCWRDSETWDVGTKKDQLSSRYSMGRGEEWNSWVLTKYFVNTGTWKPLTYDVDRTDWF